MTPPASPRATAAAASSATAPAAPPAAAPALPALPALDPRDYPVAKMRDLPTPRLLVFRARAEANIARLRTLLEGVAPATAFRHLRSHAKTPKSSWAIRLQMAAGITRFKATPNELAMLLSAGARDIFVAYPPLARTAEAIARALADAKRSGRDDLRILSQVGAPEHAEALAAAADAHDVQISFLLDLDVGMHRTGVPPGETLALLGAVRRIDRSQRLSFAGLHGYDGQSKSPDPAERARMAREAMGSVVELARALDRSGTPVPLVIAAGTPSFLPDLEVLLAAKLPGEVEVSPGTWIYGDSSTSRVLPGIFAPAAIILASVMDRPRGDRVVLDLGHKRWAIDSGPLEAFDREGLEVVSTSEEHTVLLARGDARNLRIGDRLLLVPRHVCPTVNLWESFDVIGPDGSVEIQDCPVDGRNR